MSEESTVKGDGPSHPLRGELTRVLEDQMNVIQEQQAQATRVIRVSLTTAGLILTLLSISASSGILEMPDADIVSQFSNTSIIFPIISTMITIIIMFVVLRVLAPALAVLRPELASNNIVQLAMFRLLSNNSQPSETEDILEGDTEIFDGEVALRTGIDADEATRIYRNGGTEADIIEYHIGCVRGNESIIEMNRRHLSSIYSSAGTVAFILTGLLFYLAVGISMVVSLPIF